MIQMIPMLLILLAAPAAKTPDAPPGWLGLGYVWSVDNTGQKVLHVQRVVPGGPADTARVKTGDVITSIDGRRVDFGDELDLLLYLGDRKPADHVTFGIVREGRSRRIRVRLGVMPDSSLAAWKQNLDVARRKRLAAQSTRH